jgi:hypothetical protein
MLHNADTKNDVPRVLIPGLYAMNNIGQGIVGRREHC